MVASRQAVSNVIASTLKAGAVSVFAGVNILPKVSLAVLAESLRAILLCLHTGQEKIVVNGEEVGFKAFRVSRPGERAEAGLNMVGFDCSGGQIDSFFVWIRFEMSISAAIIISPKTKVSCRDRESVQSENDQRNLKAIPLQHSQKHPIPPMPKVRVCLRNVTHASNTAQRVCLSDATKGFQTMMNSFAKQHMRFTILTLMGALNAGKCNLCLLQEVQVAARIFRDEYCDQALTDTQITIALALTAHWLE